MPKPKRKRVIFRPPLISGMRPFGSSAGTTGDVSLLHEEFEAIRLADYERLPQQEAARRMEVSRPTFSRIYDQARQKLAKALVEGQTLMIGGGDIAFDREWFKCARCHTSFSTTEASGPQNCPVCRSSDFFNISKQDNNKIYTLMPRPAIHETGFCICSKCGIKISHQAGSPCRSLICPKCNISLIREHHPIYIR